MHENKQVSTMLTQATCYLTSVESYHCITAKKKGYLGNTTLPVAKSEE